VAYNAPVTDLSFVLTDVAGLTSLQGLDGMETYDPDLVAPILDEAAKLARDVLSPLNQSGDKAGAKLTEEGVKAVPGFAEA